MVYPLNQPEGLVEKRLFAELEGLEVFVGVAAGATISVRPHAALVQAHPRNEMSDLNSKYILLCHEWSLLSFSLINYSIYLFMSV